MAKISDTAGSSNIWLGSKQNSRQSILYVPAALTANKPGLLFLESINDGATASDLGGVYLWADDANAFHVSATYPTDQDDASTIIAAASTDATLLSIAALGTGADKMLYTTGVDTWAELAVTSYGRSILDDTSEAVFKATVNLEIGTDVQAYDADLTTWAGISPSANMQTFAAAADNAAMRTALGVPVIAHTMASHSDEDSYNLSTSGTGSFTGTLASGALTVTGAATVSTTLGVTGVLTATTHVHIDADDAQLQLGNETSDSYIKFDGSTMVFYDTDVGGTGYTLRELATGTVLSPSISGDLTLTDGSITQTDADDACSFILTNNDIINGADLFQIYADSLTTVAALHIECDALTTGQFIECDRGGVVFAVGRYGDIVIAGNASGTDALTLTAGDITLTDGDSTLTDGNFVMTKGMVTVDNDADETNYFKRTIASGSTALLELETTATDDAGNALFIDSKFTTGACTAVNIDSASTTPTAGVIDVDAAITTGTVLDINMGTATTSGKGIYVLDNSADTTARNLVDVVQEHSGANGAKCMSLRQDGLEEALFIDHDNDVGAATPVLANPGAFCIDADGNDGTNAVGGIFISAANAGAGDAYGLYIDDVVASGTAYAIVTKGLGECSFNVDTDDADFTVASVTNAEMFAIDAGTDTIGINALVAGYELGINVTDNKSMGGIGMVQNDATGDTIGINVQMAGAGHAGTAIAIDHNGTVAGIGLSIDAELTTGTLIDLEPTVLTTGWAISADDADALTDGGLLDLESNSADVSARNLVQIINNNAAAIGTDCLFIDQDANSAAYSLEIDHDSNDAAVVWSVKIQHDNAGGVAGGIDFSGFSAAEPLFKFVADAVDPTGAGGAGAGRVAIDIGGAVKYLAYY